MDEHDRDIETGARWFGDWLERELRGIWPDARLAYAGPAANNSHAWRIELPGAGPLWLAVTEPALLEPMVRQLPRSLNLVDWPVLLDELRPHGLQLTASGRLFVWDPEQDRGIRLIEPE